ncbi:MAG: hypothetical protein JWL86_631 [Rhizobium sp.]|nr:hypothetical protein [Rhizobium sp.]
MSERRYFGPEAFGSVERIWVPVSFVAEFPVGKRADVLQDSHDQRLRVCPLLGSAAFEGNEIDCAACDIKRLGCDGRSILVPSVRRVMDEELIEDRPEHGNGG